MGSGILLLLFIFGCIGGLLSGVLGLGAGMVFIIIFTNYLSSQNIPDAVIAQLILANSMFVVFFSGGGGSIKQYLNGNFYFKPVCVIGFTSMICSVATTYLINNTTWYNKRIFTVIFILVTAYIAYRFFFLKEEEQKDSPPDRASTGTLLFIGFIGGIMLALAGVGSGVTMILMMIKMLDIDIRKATSISLGVVTITAFLTTIAAFFIEPNAAVHHPYTYGLIVLPMVLPTALGCLIFAPMGVNLAKKLKHKTIRLLFTVFLVAAIVNMCYSLL